MRVLILLALIGATVAVPPVPRNIQRIVGGSPTTIDQYPYMANMQICLAPTYCFQSCGGSLITTRKVLSAAHCYMGSSASEWRAVLGTSYASSGGSTHQISSIAIHENYNHALYDYDVAVLELATPAVLSKSIGVARIAGTNYNLLDGTVLTTVGWGNLQSSGPASEQLHHVDIHQINQELCAERYAYMKTQPGFENTPDVTDSMLCAGILDVGGKDACYGDSGGPVVHQKDVIVGIVSWRFRCADPTYPGVNARVSYLSDWIVKPGST